MSTMDTSRHLEQLHEPLRYLSSHAQKKRDEVERLRRELAEAEKELERFETDYKKTLTYYAQTECRQLAAMMYAKLPQELREMIYEYICVDPDRPIPVGPYYHFRPYDRPYTYPPRSNPDADPNPSLDWRVNGDGWVAPSWPVGHVPKPQGTSTVWDHDVQIDSKLVERISNVHIEQDVDNQKGDNYTILPDGRIKEEHTDKPPSDMVLPSSHFFDPRYMGPEVSHEMQKLYYARNTFSVCTVEKGISNFLGLPVGCSTLKPVNGPPSRSSDLGPLPPLFAAEHIRKLQIRVKLEHFLLDKPEREYPIDNYAYEQRFLRRTCNYLKGLDYYFKRRPKGAVEIEFVMMTEIPDFRYPVVPRYDYLEEMRNCNRIYVNFLQCIRNTVYTAMYDHGDISVKVTHYDPVISAFPRNLTRLFALTKEQWEYEKSKQQRNPNWEADFFLMSRAGVDLGAMPGMYEGDMNKLLIQRWGIRPTITSVETIHPITEGRFWPVACMKTGDDPVEAGNGSVESGSASVGRWSPESPNSEPGVEAKTEDNIGS